MNDKVELLKKECELEKLPFLGIENEYPDFYQILNDIITEKEHEKKISIQGLILCDKFKTTLKHSIVSYYLDNTSDGKKTFQLTEKNTKSKTVIFENELSQRDLLTFVNDEKNVIIIKTEKDIRIYFKGCISILEGRIWKYTPTVNSVLNQIRSIDASINITHLEKLIFFAYFELSLNKIGATIVYFNKTRFYSKWFDKSKARNIDLNKIPEQEILKNYLNFNDGAIIIDQFLKVRFSNIFLQYKPSTLKNVKKYSGTRHTSAVCFSYEKPKLYVITVSDDGPVSIFHAGKKIEELSFISFNQKLSKNRDFAEWVGKIAEERGEISDTYEEQVSCPKCNRKYILTITKLTGWNDHEEFDCPHCKIVISSHSCFSIDGAECPSKR